MSSYSEFAFVYDLLMGDVDYKKRTEYILKLFNKYGKTPTLLLDLACGTGGFSNEMSKKGIEVIGVDISEEMLGIARENSAEIGTDVLYLCQPAEELDLYGTVDGAICCLDSLNHITDINSLKRAIERVSLFLEESCLFIFDVNTLYKHERVLSNNTFVIDEEDVYCVWQNEYDEESRTTHIYLDFFTPDSDGKYIRSGEDFFERAYTNTELEELLTSTGLEILAILGDMSDKSLTDTDERAIYVTRKKGK